jgi:hypothetical protein
LFPITFQLLRFRQPSGLYSTRTGSACQESWGDETADALLSASARQTSKPLSCVSDGKRLYLVTICLSTKSAVTDWLTNYTQVNLFVKRIWKVIPARCRVSKLISPAQPAELYAFNE